MAEIYSPQFAPSFFPDKQQPIHSAGATRSPLNENRIINNNAAANYDWMGAKVAMSKATTPTQSNLIGWGITIFTGLCSILLGLIAYIFLDFKEDMKDKFTSLETTVEKKSTEFIKYQIQTAADVAGLKATTEDLRSTVKEISLKLDNNLLPSRSKK